MLKIRSSIPNFFKLVLRVAIKLAPNARYKSFAIAKVLSKKRSEIRHENIYAYIDYEIALILGPIEANALFEKKNFKQNAIGFSGLSDIEKIFALLAIVVVVHL